MLIREKLTMEEGWKNEPNGARGKRVVLTMRDGGSGCMGCGSLRQVSTLLRFSPSQDTRKQGRLRERGGRYYECGQEEWRVKGPGPGSCWVHTWPAVRTCRVADCVCGSPVQLVSTGKGREAGAGSGR